MDPIRVIGVGRARRLIWIAVWLAFLVYPISDVVNGHYGALKSAAAAAWFVVFVTLYLATMWAAFGGDPRHPERTPVWPLIALVVLTVPVIVVYGINWVGGIIYLSVAAGSTLPSRRAYTVIALLAALQVLLVWTGGASVAGNWDLYLLTLGLGVMMLFWRRSLALIADLHEAREEVARLAVSDERLRIARDLHDVLGHSLSVIALKAQVSRRTMHADPAGARAALGDVEQVAQESLRELRQMVAGYREQTLAGELRGAAEVLAAAGVELEVRQTAEHIAGETDAALAWAVREGVSNVLRHSRATHCRISISAAGADLRFELFDHGVGADDAASSAGHGLRGLRERMAKLGGTLDAGASPGGGFRLAAQLPTPE